jgi:cell division protein FtsW (lipid II flippase)
MIWVVLALKYLVLLLICLFVLVIFFNRGAGGKINRAALLVLRSGSAAVPEGKRWELGKGVVLGRSSDCAVSLPDPYVSNRHARIILQDKKYYVTDLGSTNGTLLENHYLTAPQILRNGSQLQVGGFTLRADLPEQNQARRSFLLPLFPGLILGDGSLELYREQLLSTQDIALLAVAALFLVVSSFIVEYKGKGDPLIIHIIGVLSALGLIFIFRVNPYYGLRQAYWVLAGYTLFWLIQIFLSEYRRLLDYKYTFMVLSIVFLIFTIIFGVEAGGARSWLSLGSFRFQASEFVKVFMVIFLAGYLEENKEILRVGTLKFGRFYLPDWPYLGPLLVVCGFSLLLLVFQKDLGMALLFFVTFLVMVYIATERSYYLLLGLGLFSIGAVLMYYIFPHVQSRILIYLDPWQQIDGGGYQVVQSLFAISGGGIFGMGLGSGFPKLIPAVHTDFIFSLIGEELGLLGVMGILGIYYLLVWKGLRISFNAPDGFGSLLACGFSAILALQTLIIVGGVISVIPLTGIPLPFLSYGGSSFVSNCFLMGILYKVNAESERDVDQHGASMRAVEVDR